MTHTAIAQAAKEESEQRRAARALLAPVEDEGVSAERFAVDEMLPGAAPDGHVVFRHLHKLFEEAERPAGGCQKAFFK